MYDLDLNVGFHKLITTTIQRQITLKQNPKPNKSLAAANKVPKVVQVPLDALLLAPTGYKAQRPKNSVTAPGLILDVNLFEWFPSTSNGFVPEASAIGSVMKLYFQTYKEH
jgi:hypothetical protein